MNSTMKNLCLAGALGMGALVVGRAMLRRSRWFSFNDKIVLVTGSSRGLGLVLARELIDRGARVVLCARSEEDLEEAARELQPYGDVLAIPCDIRDFGQVQTMVQEVLERWGRIDVLINNAGVIQVGPLDAMTREDFRQAMDIHFWGPLNTIQAVLPSMRSQGWGRIVNIASIGGKVAVPHMVPYCASKFALVGLSDGLRTELAPEGILVTTVNPGLMRTGSPRNAFFKGQHRDEYAWFSISDSLPLVSGNARRAARSILTACQNGDPEVTVLPAGKLLVGLKRLMPNVVTEIATLVNGLLPEMGGIGRRSARGYQSQSSASPSWMTRLSEEAAVRNNEVGAASARPENIPS